MEAVAAISFPCPLAEPIPNSKAGVTKVNYIPEGKVLEPGSVPGCNGSGLEPIAEPGFLCIYQGASAKAGLLEKEWQNAKFFATADPVGNVGATKFSGKIGELVLFRTSTFVEGTPTTTIPAAAMLSAAGSWAVAAPCPEEKKECPLP
jgi:hypothetical protein